ncbi:MAG: cytochrome c oxidase subunit 3 [Chlamydiales bacterium]
MKASNQRIKADSYQIYSRTIFGFWIYLMTDFMLFTTLFATYAVLHHNVFEGPSGRDLFNLRDILLQTLVFLISSCLMGFGSVMAHRRDKKWTVFLFISVFLLGTIFFWMGIQGLSYLVIHGYNWQQSAFLSIYFTIIGTYNLHLLFALLWLIVFMIPVIKYGLTDVSIRRLTCLRIFWQFLGIIWIFIFTVVYLLGVI